jgi:DNA-binding GntR family transcriptional regulator
MIPSLSHDGPVPVYRQIRDWMYGQIASNAWPEHYKLMAETDLATMLGVSRGTVRKAISELIAEGLLVQIHGRGTFVSSHRLEQPLADRLVTFSEDLIGRNVPFETFVLEQTVVHPSQRIASLLSLGPDAEILYLKRVRVVRGMPLIFLKNHVVLSHCDRLRSVDFTRVRLLQALEDLCGLQLDWARRTFEAQAATNEVAEMLKIAPCDPVMYMEQVLYLQGGSPIEVSDLWLRGNHFRVSAIVKREGKNASVSHTSPEYSSLVMPPKTDHE